MPSMNSPSKDSPFVMELDCTMWFALTDGTSSKQTPTEADKCLHTGACPLGVLPHHLRNLSFLAGKATWRRAKMPQLAAPEKSPNMLWLPSWTFYPSWDTRADICSYMNDPEQNQRITAQPKLQNAHHICREDLSIFHTIQGMRWVHVPGANCPLLNHPFSIWLQEGNCQVGRKVLHFLISLILIL